MDATLNTLRNLIMAAGLADDTRQVLSWCFKMVAPLYREFCRVCDRRYAEDILRLVATMLNGLARKVKASPDGLSVVRAFLAQVQALQEHLVLQPARLMAAA